MYPNLIKFPTLDHFGVTRFLDNSILWSGLWNRQVAMGWRPHTRSWSCRPPHPPTELATSHLYNARKACAILLVVDLPLWKMMELKSQLNGKIKNVPKHQPESKCVFSRGSSAPSTYWQVRRLAQLETPPMKRRVSTCHGSWSSEIRH